MAAGERAARRGHAREVGVADENEVAGTLPAAAGAARVAVMLGPRPVRRAWLLASVLGAGLWFFSQSFAQWVAVQRRQVLLVVGAGLAEVRARTAASGRAQPESG